MTIADFLNQLTTHYKEGTATEHSYRAPLQALLNTLAPENAHVQNEPKRIPGVGAVDFEITINRLPIAHLEAKDIGIDLRTSKGRNKTQRETYLAAYGNLCYTNGLEWDFYDNGKLYDSIHWLFKVASGINFFLVSRLS